MARRVSATCLLSLVLLTFPVAVGAQEPQSSSPTTRLIPYSAVLPDAGPDGAAGARAITFALYDEAEGGTRLWSETQTVAIDSRGRYTVHLGSSTALPLEIFRTEQARWLEVSIDGKAPPRVMLVAVPYALRAADAETLGGTPASEFVRTDANGRRIRADGTTIDDPLVNGTGVPNQLAKWSGTTTLSSSIVSESLDNRIGIFAPDPTGGGVVDSRFTIRHLDNNTAIGVLNTSNQRRFALNTFVNGAFQFFDGGGGTWNPGLMQSSGRLGLGTITPSARIHVLNDQNVQGLFVDQQTGQHAIRAHTQPFYIAVLGMASDSFSNLSGPTAGVLGFSDAASGHALYGSADGNVAGLFVVNSGSGPAGQFVGNVIVNGTLSKAGGSFEIDHPLDPANKYLRHSFVESPDMMNVYNGNVVLDTAGEAWVTLPDWFEALNRDFRYQLTAIGAPGRDLHVAVEVSGNRFKIAGGRPGAKVSWQVTGIRQDAWASAHRIVVEEDKSQEDRGAYLHPAERGLDGAALVPSIRSRLPIRIPR